MPIPRSAARPAAAHLAAAHLAAVLLALAPLPALANPAPLALTGPLAAAVGQAAATPGIDADEAAAIMAAIMAGSASNPATAINAEEQALLQALSKARAPFPVTLDGRPATIGPLQPEAARFMDLIFRGNPNAGAQLQAGNPELQLHLARLYGLPDQGSVSQARMLMATDLMQAWRNSTVGNSYEPLRQKLGSANRLYEAAAPATRKSGRRLLFSAMDLVDRQANDSVPDFLYQWLKN